LAGEKVGAGNLSAGGSESETDLSGITARSMDKAIADKMDHVKGRPIDGIVAG
jgi:hypothetical protein